MSRTNRRRMLQFAMAAAFSAPLVVQPARAASALISPPTSPLLFRRTLERELSGGAIFLVTREFSVSFVRFSDGFIVDGKQVRVDVQVPAGLEHFAALEETREEIALFPLSLDPTGLIVSGAISPATGTAVEDAFDEAARMLAQQRIPASEREQLLQFVESFHRAGTIVTAYMPVDLFVPDEVERREDQTIALPTGEQGRILSRFGGERDHATGLMRFARREVLTQIDQDRRWTRERWQLTPA